MDTSIFDNMSAKELDLYARAMELDCSKLKGVKAKREFIKQHLTKQADIKIFGNVYTVPVKRLTLVLVQQNTDPWVSGLSVFFDNLHNLPEYSDTLIDLLNGKNLTDDKLFEAMRLVLGDEQFDDIYAHCTEDDGLVNMASLTYAYLSVFENEELKNF
mgnify:CR=1 FL=1